MNNLTRGLSKVTSAVTLIAALPFIQLQAAELQINWIDNSTNEDGFIIEKRLQSSTSYETLIQLPQNTITYIDSNVNVGESFCYQVSAYNVAGRAPSTEVCVDVPENEVVITPPPASGTGEAQISFQFINKPISTELDGKKLYGFKSDYTFNSEYTNDEITNVSFDINSGSLGNRDRDYLIFTEQGSEIENGYASMSFNETNELAFTLTANGNDQTARLYMMAGAWTSESAGILVTAGSEVTRVEIPKGYTWHYIAVDINYKETVDIKVMPDSTHSGYSSVMFSGVVLNNQSTQSYAAVQSIDLSSSKIIDVTNKKYITAVGNEGGFENSSAQFGAISFLGNGKLREGTYSFTDNQTEIDNGYWGMSWDQENKVITSLTSASGEVNYASVYFRAGAWSNDTSSINLIVNGTETEIELPKNRTWFYIKADIEFEGVAEIVIEPQGHHGSYSQVAFAGITVE